MCGISETMFLEVYRRLGIDKRLTVKGESFYNDKLEGVVNILDEQGVLTVDNGAKLMFIEGIDAPLIVRKGDGGFGYDATDLAALRYRVADCKGTWLIYVVDAGQALHFKLLFEGAKKAGWTDNVRIDHTEFGVVTGEDGKKFKTRSGDTVRLVDLLDEARDRAREQLLARKSEGKCLLSDGEIESAAERLGYGGVKYFDLKQHRINNYQFSYDRMLSPDGDTCVYLQYSHARIAQIAKKVGIDDVHALALKGGKITLAHRSEVGLAMHIIKFKEAIHSACVDLLPHVICNYVYGLTIKFSDFYRDCRVAGSPEETSRLLLCEVTALTMRKCFALLGIDPIYKL
jgi:arginyl-tRNA synthetase